ncbi:Ima1 N-terminal domain-containing protein [Hysterangium stoloniferum]|nr:Ima1 N-terminal domain-containing protein [Hysterangium stoloniferum]
MRVFQSPPPPPTCFFCQTPLSKQPRNPRSFKCSACDCWNRYDERGEIVSDDPAMHDEALNASSFSKRASPSKNRLPTSYAKSPFCHTCLTNQTLLVNLLSNYLPSTDDPTYEVRLAEMSRYTAALQARYPPVCKDCQPSVDEELQDKEHKARTTALGGWLKRSQHVGTQRSIEQHRGRREALVWRIRGVLWALTWLAFLAVDMAGVLQYDLDQPSFAVLFPIFTLISVLWHFWDPTWSTVRLSRLQGRGFTVSGRQRYIKCQIIIWLTRFITSCLLALNYWNKLLEPITPLHIRSWHIGALATEVVLAVFSLIGLQINRPPKVRLLEPRSINNERTLRSSGTPTSQPSPDPLFANFSLAPQAPTSSTAPVFGKTSFPSPLREIETPEEDMMDWTPTNPPEKVHDREDWLRPQRFFPPEQPTGLEDLFQKAARLDGDPKKEDERLEALQRAQKEAGLQYREVWLFAGAGLAIALISGLSVYHFI